MFYKYSGFIIALLVVCFTCHAQTETLSEKYAEDLSRAITGKINSSFVMVGSAMESATTKDGKPFKFYDSEFSIKYYSESAFKSSVGRVVSTYSDILWIDHWSRSYNAIKAMLGVRDNGKLYAVTIDYIYDSKTYKGTLIMTVFEVDRSGR